MVNSGVTSRMLGCRVWFAPALVWALVSACSADGSSTVDVDGAVAEPVLCGNGVVDPGESCDTAITYGQAGSCVTDAQQCDDQDSCTMDAVAQVGSCQAACTHQSIPNCQGGCEPSCVGQCKGASDGCGGTCATHDCSGCCDASLACHPGTTAARCGVGGGVCLDCGAMKKGCIGGQCSGPCVPSCDGECKGAPDGCGGTCASNGCSGCCDASLSCKAGTSASLCGMGGLSCLDCLGLGQNCASGKCVTTCTPNCAGKCKGASNGCGGTCTSNGCSGCCDASLSCKAGTSSTQCGAGGTGCQNCTTQGKTCSNQQCVASCTPNCAGKCKGASDGCGGTCTSNGCSGCCDASLSCKAGTSSTQCGAGGTGCQNCTTQGKTCSNQQCVASCTPNCTGKCKGASNGCGGTCATNGCTGCCLSVLNTCEIGMFDYACRVMNIEQCVFCYAGTHCAYGIGCLSN